MSDAQRVHDLVVATGWGLSVSAAFMMGIYGLWSVSLLLLIVAAFLVRCHGRDVEPEVPGDV